MSDQLIPPNEETTGLETFSKWVWKRWLVIFSSGGFAVFGLIWGFLGFTITSLPWLICFYLIIFFVMIYVATHQLWQYERKDKLEIIETVKSKDLQVEQLLLNENKLEDQVKQLENNLLLREKDRKPSLTGSVKDIQINQITDNTGTRILGTRISLYLAISNASKIPTSISEFILDVVDNKGAHFLGYAGDDLSKFGFGKQLCTFTKFSSIDNQSLIERFNSGQKAKIGKRHEGWLFFDFDLILDPEHNFDWGKCITLKAVDAFDEKHVIDGGVLRKYDNIV